MLEITYFENLKNKAQIVENWLPRYTGCELEEFGSYIILVNFKHYVELFAKWNKTEVRGRDKAMPSATADGITIINFGMGSPNAATIMDLLTAIRPKACSILRKVWWIKEKKQIGRFYFANCSS